MAKRARKKLTKAAIVKLAEGERKRIEETYAHLTKDERYALFEEISAHMGGAVMDMEDELDGAAR